MESDTVCGWQIHLLAASYKNAYKARESGIMNVQSPNTGMNLAYG